MKRLFVIMLIIAIGLFVAGCGSSKAEEGSKDRSEKNQPKGEKSKGDKKKGKSKDKDDSIPVQIVKPKRGDISSYLLFSSNIDSEKVADIYPMATGIIEKISKDEGDEVSKGDVLAKLDSREASINERKSKVRLDQLKLEFDRKKELFNKKLISKEDYEKATFDLNQAELDWKQNKLLLSYTDITSPISGVVSKRHIKVGNKITTAQLAFSVIYVKEKIAVVNIPEQEKDQVFKGQKVVVSTKSATLEGKVKRISPAIDPESGTFKVTVTVKDPKGKLSVGQFVNVKIVKKVHKNVILLTKEALIYDGGRIYVFKVDGENKAMKNEVTIGFDDGTQVEVVKGVGISDKLVSAGKSSLKNKTKVKIIDPVI